MTRIHFVLLTKIHAIFETNIMKSDFFQEKCRYHSNVDCSSPTFKGDEPTLQAFGPKRTPYCLLCKVLGPFHLIATPAASPHPTPMDEVVYFFPVRKKKINSTDTAQPPYPPSFFSSSLFEKRDFFLRNIFEI